jgi:hypothetical protein
MMPDNYEHIDDYLELRLNEWGEWLRIGNSLGIGYPRQSILALIQEGKIITKNKKFRSIIETHENAEEIEKLVSEMAQYKLYMAQALRSYYLDSLSLRSGAKKLGISHTQYNLYVQMAKQWLVGRMSLK